MAKDTKDVISTLNNLIETCRDGQEGFMHAAEQTKSPELQSLFDNFARQRSQFVNDLQVEVRRLGGDPEQHGSAGGSLHRGWIDLKAKITGRDEHAIVAECERGEDAAVRNYEEALEEDLPDDLLPVVERQYMQIVQAHDRIRALETTTDKS
ncbi:MAG: PA2169 family four-helix-bundle protein [Gemmatimonadota bacterium]